MRQVVAALLSVALGACASASATKAEPTGAPQGPWRQQDHAIPMRNADGSTSVLAGRICRPAGDAPARLAVIAHGSPARAEDRARYQLNACDGEVGRWFLSRGFAVAFALRRGYGATGGPYYESSLPCSVDGFVHSAHESARDLGAVIDYVTALPGIRPDGVVLVGQSAGGWAALG